MPKHPWLDHIEIPIYMGDTGRTLKKDANPKPTVTPPENSETKPDTPATNSPFKKVLEGAPEELATKISNITALNSMLEKSVTQGQKTGDTVKNGLLRQYQKLMEYKNSKNITDPTYLAELDRLKNLIDQF